MLSTFSDWAFDGMRVGVNPVDVQFLHIGLYRCGIAHVEVQFAGFGSLNAHDCDIVFQRCENGSGICDTVDDI